MRNYLDYLIVTVDQVESETSGVFENNLSILKEGCSTPIRYDLVSILLGSDIDEENLAQYRIRSIHVEDDIQSPIIAIGHIEEDSFVHVVDLTKSNPELSIAVTGAWAAGCGVAASEAFRSVELAMSNLRINEAEIPKGVFLAAPSGVVDHEELISLIDQVKIYECCDYEEIKKVNRQTSFGGLFNKNKRGKW